MGDAPYRPVYDDGRQRLDAGPAARASFAAQARYPPRRDLGSTSTEGKLLAYPPLHQHHFHVEEYKADWFAGGLIAHGDDQCHAHAGGVACLVHRHAPGHVQRVTTPLSVDADVNDVRAAGSPPLTHWAVVALKSIREVPPSSEPLPADAAVRSSGRLQALTQMRLAVMPLPVRNPGYPGTYGVPSNQTSAFFREGRFLVDTPLAWSYLHTHGQQIAAAIRVPRPLFPQPSSRNLPIGTTSTRWRSTSTRALAASV